MANATVLARIRRTSTQIDALLAPAARKRRMTLARVVVLFADYTGSTVVARDRAALVGQAFKLTLVADVAGRTQALVPQTRATVEARTSRIADEIGADERYLAQRALKRRRGAVAHFVSIWFQSANATILTFEIAQRRGCKMNGLAFGAGKSIGTLEPVLESETMLQFIIGRLVELVPVIGRLRRIQLDRPHVYELALSCRYLVDAVHQVVVRLNAQ